MKKKKKRKQSKTIKQKQKQKNKKKKKLKTKQTKELNRRNSLTKKTSSKHTQTVQQIERKRPLPNTHKQCNKSEKKAIKPNKRGNILLNKHEI